MRIQEKKIIIIIIIIHEKRNVLPAQKLEKQPSGCLSKLLWGPLQPLIPEKQPDEISLNTSAAFLWKKQL